MNNNLFSDYELKFKEVDVIRSKPIEIPRHGDKLIKIDALLSELKKMKKEGCIHVVPDFRHGMEQGFRNYSFMIYGKSFRMETEKERTERLQLLLTEKMKENKEEHKDTVRRLEKAKEEVKRLEEEVKNYKN